MGTKTTTARWLYLVSIAAIATLGACAGGGDDGGGGGDDDGGNMIDPAALLDDLEDGDGAIEEVEGRIGAWFTYNDETANATQTPSTTSDFTATEGGAHDSMYAAVTKGSGFKEWGAGMGFDINNTGEGGEGDGGVKKPWDASKYTGVTFMAKGNVPVRVGILVSGAVDKAEGGGCTPPATPTEGQDCGDSHGKSFSLSGEWKQYKLPFAGLKQDGWGAKADFDAKTITSVMFDIAPNVEFEVAIDDLGFY